MLRPPPSSTLFSYTTLFRSNRAGDLLHLVELHVAHQPVALLQRRIVDAVHADVDDHGARLHHVAGDELGLADRDDERSEEHTSELQSRQYLVCRLLLEKKKK